MTLAESHASATYDEIKAHVKKHTGLTVSTLNIAQVKRKCGIIERECCNKAKSDNAKQPQCPADKGKAIEEALRFFGMIFDAIQRQIHFPPLATHIENPAEFFAPPGFLYIFRIYLFIIRFFSFISTRYTPKASDTRPALRSGKPASPHRKRLPSFRRSRARFRACFRRMKAPVLPSRFSDTFPIDSGFRFHSAFCR